MERNKQKLSDVLLVESEDDDSRKSPNGLKAAE
jgi:hypothetical protein